MGRTGLKAQEGGLGEASTVLGTAEKSGLVIHMLPRKQKPSPRCSPSAQSLQPCHSRESRNVPSEAPLPRKSGCSEDEFPWDWLVRLWCGGPGKRGLPDPL